MIRTLVIPKHNHMKLDLNFPEDYLGQEVEIIAFRKQEGVLGVKSKNTMADFCGVLSEGDYKSLKIHTGQARSEWNRDIGYIQTL